MKHGYIYLSESQADDYALQADTSYHHAAKVHYLKISDICYCNIRSDDNAVVRTVPVLSCNIAD